MNEEFTMKNFIERMLNSSHNSHCPIRKALELLSGKWRTHVIYELFKKPSCRFGELKNAIPKITNTMLTTTLRDLENKGLVKREQFNEIPPHVEYSLTDKGRDLLPVFYEIAKWTEKHSEEKV